MITEGQPPGKFEVLSVRYEWVRFAGALNLVMAGGGEVGKVAEARFQALNDGWLPVQDKGAASIFSMLYSKLLFFSDFGLLFVWEHFFISFSFFSFVWD